jgi:hypothetical protein
VGSVVERDDFGLACTLSGFAVDNLGAAVGSSPSAGIQAAVAV